MLISHPLVQCNLYGLNRQSMHSVLGPCQVEFFLVAEFMTRHMGITLGTFNYC